MTQQLQLLDATPTWRLDAGTREIGRRGVARARAALAAARQGADGAEGGDAGRGPHDASDADTEVSLPDAA